MSRSATTNAAGRAPGGRHPVRPVRVGHLAAERAHRQRRPGVHEHAGPGDQADQRVPARERQQEEQPDDERGDQPDPRDAVAVDPAEDLREVPVPGQAVADPRRPGRVDQPGAGRGDEGVDPQDVRQPAHPAQDRDRGERPGVQLRDRRIARSGARAGEADQATVAAEQSRRQGDDERHLEQAVDRGADQDRDDDRQRQVAPRVLDLPGQLVALLEAGVGEDDARGRQRAEQGLDPARHEARAPGGEVAGVQAGSAAR